MQRLVLNQWGQDPPPIIAESFGICDAGHYKTLWESYRCCGQGSSYGAQSNLINSYYDHDTSFNTANSPKCSLAALL